MFNSEKPLRNLAYVFILCCIMSIASCSSLWPFGKDEEEKDPEIDPNETAESLYQDAHRALLARDINTAVEKFEVLEGRYPFGSHAQQAQLELAYSYYKLQDTDQATRSIDRFIQLNPLHPNLDYAYYLKGLIAFDSGRSFLHLFVTREPSRNDPTPLRESFEVFGLLVEQFPDSEYAEDAQQRMVYLRNELAKYEMNVGEFYIRRGAYVASANRARYIIENYQGASVMPQALVMLEKSYERLGINDLAEDSKRVFDQNFTKEDLFLEKAACKKSIFRSIAEYLFYLEKKLCT